MTKPLRKYGLLMDLPEDKRAGYYAQIVKALAGRAALFDRDKELLIFSKPGERDDSLPIMQQYAIPYEETDLLLLPAEALLAPTFTDFGLVSRQEHPYVFADLAAVFRLAPAPGSGRPSEPDQAFAQLQEHLLAWYAGESEGIRYGVAESHHRELMERIAVAYGCEVSWVEPE
ncbi:hypothetical protein O9H85_01875 [Paenibacillus filicis]|uniref:Uncharacterized protein n=1 Tax=Paenibacillus gyeongsangnamensis TaxID=3388067 RepID=A0ABT4Q320_9BACL|nr:hypothetical protein [Paenibacillus filicis]MCZ8511206.1 hypothetical protein [Paenibacillus filicis]